jgi:uncharacterized membrane protein YgdD (TMEM256/DUF423 family)
VLLSAAGASLLVATIAGAVGSHALTFADAQALRSFETAVHFQFFHGLGVIAIALVGLAGRSGQLRAAAAWLMIAVRFSSAVAFTHERSGIRIVAAAPYGGVAFMVGWLAFAASPWIGGEDA